MSPFKHSDVLGPFPSKSISSQSLQIHQEGTEKSQGNKGRADSVWGDQSYFTYSEGHGDETPLDNGHAAINRRALYEELRESPPLRRRQDSVMSL